MSNLQDNNFGFTLLEMLLVLTLLAGAGFVLLIKLPMNFEKQQLDLATTQLLGDIRDTRQAALSENNWYDIKFYVQNEDHYYQIFRQGTRIKTIHLKDKVQFSACPKELRIIATGQSVGTTIVLTSPSGRQRSVIVAPVGMRIREK